jgi:hypothetical protein
MWILSPQMIAHQKELADYKMVRARYQFIGPRLPPTYLSKK